MAPHFLDLGGFPPSRPDDREDRLDNALANRQATQKSLSRDQFLTIHNRLHGFLGRAGGGEEHAPFRVHIRVTDVDL
jgi:hypothetical protein